MIHPHAHARLGTSSVAISCPPARDACTKVTCIARLALRRGGGVTILGVVPVTPANTRRLCQLLHSAAHELGEQGRHAPLLRDRLGIRYGFLWVLGRGVPVPRVEEALAESPTNGEERRGERGRGRGERGGLSKQILLVLSGLPGLGPLFSFVGEEGVSKGQWSLT